MVETGLGCASTISHIDKDVVKSIKNQMAKYQYHFNRNQPRIPLSIPTFGFDEVLDALESMITTNVTMGEKVFKFEEEFASYIGVKNGIMVNSGSSANLVALSTVTNPTLEKMVRPGFEAIVPAVTWSTTVFPVHNTRGIPVLIDVQPDTFDMGIQSVKSAISSKSHVIMPVHLLGNPVDMEAIVELAKSRDLILIEDSCEAHGAEFSGRKVGSFGDLSTFSFFFSHHISTIEGGMVLTNDDQYAEVARSLRAHGWVRELREKDKFTKLNPNIDSRFLFVNLGYNLRPTEIQGAFGLSQLEKLERFIEARRRNASFLTKHLTRYAPYIRLQKERQGTRHVWFGYPVSVCSGAPFTSNEIRNYLEAKGVETRPVMAGNLAEQPAMNLIPHRTIGDLVNSREIMRDSFFIGIHHGLDSAALDYIVSCFDNFFRFRKLY